jgi:predicted RNA-binding Zn ribbon-like protein
MVGKPNFPDDVDARDLKGSAVGTPGLTALDEEREASLADEGGVSGAAAESQDLETLRRPAEDLPVAHLQHAEPDVDRGDGHGMTLLVAAVSFAAAALGVLAYRRWAS